MVGVTTFQMDGLMTQKDIDERNLVYKQCRACSKWTMMDISKPESPCSNIECGETKYDKHSTKSKRTFNKLVDSKRKVK